MRRDYFTCVFLGLIAGALVFVCFEPLYFVYGGIRPRTFGVFEIVMSIFYSVFFVLVLPFVAAHLKKYWINWGLAAYGLLAYLPLWFYPADALLEGSGSSLGSGILAMILSGIYGMCEAPFAPMSVLIGNSAASKLIYWLFPLAIFWPVFSKIVTFYRNAYIAEQLTPAAAMSGAASAERHHARDVMRNGASEPEVLGTVITAPVSAASPEEVKRNAATAATGRVAVTSAASAEPSYSAQRQQVARPAFSGSIAGSGSAERIKASGVDEPEGPRGDAREADGNYGRTVRPAVRPVHLNPSNSAGSQSRVTKAAAGPQAEGSPVAGSNEGERVITLGPPPVSDDTICLGPPPAAAQSFHNGQTQQSSADGDEQVIHLAGPVDKD